MNRGRIVRSIKGDFEYENKRLRVAMKHLFAAHKIIKKFDAQHNFKNIFGRIKIIFVKSLFKQKYQLLLHVLEEEVQWEIDRNQKIWIDRKW